MKSQLININFFEFIKGVSIWAWFFLKLIAITLWPYGWATLIVVFLIAYILKKIREKFDKKSL